MNNASKIFIFFFSYFIVKLNRSLYWCHLMFIIIWKLGSTVQSLQFEVEKRMGKVRVIGFLEIVNFELLRGALGRFRIKEFFCNSKFILAYSGH